MKRIAALTALFLFGITAGAQTVPPHVTLSATITDPLGHPYSKAFYQIQMIDSAGRAIPGTTRATYQGQPVAPTQFTGNLDTTGTFTLSVVPNNAVGLVPTTTQWQINISAPNNMYLYNDARYWSLQYTAVLTADTNLSSQLSAIAQPVSYIDVNGPSAFRQPVYGLDPTDPKMLATKGYVDAAVGGGSSVLPGTQYLLGRYTNAQSPQIAPANLTTDATGNNLTVPNTLTAQKLAVTGCATGQVPLGDGSGTCVTAAGSVTASPQFSLFYQPTSGTQSTAQGDPNVTTDGSGNVTGVSLKAKTLGGLRYSAQYGTGLLGAMGANQTVITGPDDSTTATNYSFTNMIPNVPSSFVWRDTRHNNQGVSNFYHNWGYTRHTTFADSNDGDSDNCLLDQPYSGSSSNTDYGCYKNLFYDTTPGVSLGNSLASINWQIGQAFTINYFSNGSGIREAANIAVNHYGVGDTAIVNNVTSHGGNTAFSDEGTEIADLVTEETFQFNGACATGCSTGSTAVKLNVLGSAGLQGTGRYVIDQTAGATANTVTNLATGLDGSMEAVTVGTTVAVSNAWGVLAGNAVPDGSTLTSPPFGSAVTVSVTVTSGTFDTTHLLCFAGGDHEQIIPSSVTGTGPVSITFPHLRRPHASGTRVFQGGMCGYALEIKRDSTTAPYVFDVLGSTTANILQTTLFTNGVAARAPSDANLYNTGSVATITSNGTTVYATGLTTSVGNPPKSINKLNFIFSGASDASLNGTVCTNVVWLNNAATILTCTMAGLTGQHSATTANWQYATAAGVLWSTVNLWPIAEVLDVQNETLTPPSMDGTLALEPNIIPIAASDTIAELNAATGRFTAHRSSSFAFNPHATDLGFFLTMTGGAVQGGNGSLSSNGFFQVTNGQADNWYLDNGGAYTAPNGFNWTGAYNIWANLDHGPAAGNSFINLASSAVQNANPAYNYNLFGTSAGSILVTPFFGDIALTANGQLQLGGTGANVHFNTNSDGITFNDRILLSAISDPTGGAVAQGPGVGSLADGTYCYRVVCNNLSGHTLASTEACGAVSNGGANSAKFTWNRDKGAVSSCSVYGRTTGAEHFMTTIANIGTGTPLYFVDDGSITPSGALPSQNTSQPFIDQAAFVGFNSLGATGPTAFETKLQAPASLGASYFVTFPETATVGSLVDKLAGATTIGRVVTFSNTTGRIQDSGTLLTALAPLASPALTGTPTAPTQAAGDTSTDIASDAFVYASTSKVVTCGTTTTCSNTAQASPRIVWGTVTLAAGTATVASMTAWTSTTSFSCTGTDQTAAAAVKIVNASTTSITITGTGTDVIAYQCIGN